MRFLEFKETETATKIYAIGDSHAVAVAGTGKFISLATNGRSAMNGANDDAVGKVTPGSTVVLSAGANDMTNPNKQQVVSRISSLISALQQKDCKVFYILFAETDNPKFAQDRNQLRQLVKSSLPAGVEVIDMGKLSMASGDGIHAPMGWYASASAKVKAGAKPGQAPTPTPTSTGRMPWEHTFIQVPTGPKMGSRGVEVINLQRALMALGYDVGRTKDDGILGKYTSAAISKFQADNKLQATGTATPETVQAVNKAVAANPKATKLQKAKPEEFKGKIEVSALGDKESRAVLSKEAQSQGIKGKELAAFLAQCSHESGGFRYLSEIWGPTAAQNTYDGRMGNNKSGDGYRYRGRGYIQLTGKNNYTAAGRALGLDLVKNPDQASTPDIGAKTSVWFWKTNVQPRVSNWDDVTAITKIVNGGYNGLDDRKMRYAAFTQAMNVA